MKNSKQIEKTAKGQIVILNGTPRSGKTSIAHIIQNTFEGIWVNIGVDPFKKLIHPKRYSPGIGFRPTSKGYPALEPIIVKLYEAMYESIAAHSRLGINVVVDVGHHDCYSKPLGIFENCLMRIHRLPVFIVGIRCPVEEIMERRRNTWSSTPSKDEPIPEEVFLWQEEVHKPGIYDLEIDTSQHPSEECAKIIMKSMINISKPMAIDKILLNDPKSQTIVSKTPVSASEITVQWIKSALHNEPWSHELISIETEKDFGSWSGLGNIVRVKLYSSDEDYDSKSIIVKFQGSCTYPEREGQIYRLLSEAKVHSIPKFYGVFGNGTLVLEEMKNTRPGSQTKNCTITEARNIISLLAEVNGRFWGNKRIPATPSKHFAGVIDYRMEQCWDIFREKYHEMLGEVASEFDWMWKNSETVSTHHNSKPTTLNHGDVHLENLLFSNDKDDKPILIDWQLAGQKVLPFDLSFFLVKSLTVEDRRENEDQLLKDYFDLLPSQLQDYYGFDNFFLDYRACVTRSMLSAVMSVGPMFESRPNQFELASVLATRVIAAVKDLRPVDAINELIEHGSLVHS